MIVSQILQSKPQINIATVKSSSTVSDAAGILSNLKIGALVVSEDGKHIDGMLSERDIVREIGKRGAGCMSEAVADLMTKNVVTCKKSDPADGVLALMTKGRFRHMPVVDGDEMVGMISIGDVVNARLSEMAMEKEALEGMIKGF